MTRKNVYLDNAATTPMDPKVIEKISSEMTNDFGNASSQHAFGRKARQVVEAARHQLAETINAEDKEMVITLNSLLSSSCTKTFESGNSCNFTFVLPTRVTCSRK